MIRFVLIQQDARYVLAIQDYVTTAESLLSFKVDTVIQLLERDGGNEDGEMICMSFGAGI